MVLLLLLFGYQTMFELNEVKVLATRLTCDVVRPGFKHTAEHLAYMKAKQDLVNHAALVAQATAVQEAKEVAAHTQRMVDCAVLLDIRKQLRNK